MRTDFDLLSTAPPDCTPAEDHMEARAEGRRYIELLRRFCGPEPEGSTLRVRSNPHDLGDYVTVVYFFDDERKDHIEYMQKLESDGPLNWEGT
jgi:hypothetical protein